MNSENEFSNAVRREELRTFFDGSPTARLLRSDLAPFILDFLNINYKSGEAISFGQSELRSRLGMYQSDLHVTDPDFMTGSVERYLTQWAEQGWLRRFVEANSTEPQYQLTAHSEEAIRFVDGAVARRKNMVGTESRLRLVIDTLEDIVRGANADPEQRLKYLRAQRDELDKEIMAIESGKSVQVYRPAQIRERFQTAIQLLKGLQSDFRAVEERFQEIARQVQKHQSSGHDSRGGILGFALDAEDLMKQQDEGISFFAFVKFLFSPTQQALVRKNIEEIQKLVTLSDQRDSLSYLHRMVPSLLAEADKVMRTTARLSATLRRLLDARAAADRVRLAQVLQEIRKAALQLQLEPPREIGIVVHSEAEMSSPLTRPFWTPSMEFDAQEPIEHIYNAAQAEKMLEAFAKLQRLDYRKLRRSIRECTHEGQAVTLSQIVASSPTNIGLVEVLGCIQIAHDDGHQIDHNQSETISLAESRGRSIRVVVPKVTFLPKAINSHSISKPR